MVTAGCGKSISLEGTVTVDGEPVKKGLIVFSPDVASDNDGPSASGQIEDGRFRLAKGQTPTPGTNIATVNDLENNVGYRVKVEIPEGGGADVAVEIDSSTQIE